MTKYCSNWLYTGPLTMSTDCSLNGSLTCITSESSFTGTYTVMRYCTDSSFTGATTVSANCSVNDLLTFSTSELSFTRTYTATRCCSDFSFTGLLMLLPLRGSSPGCT